MNYNIKEQKVKVCRKCNGVFPATSEYWHKDKKGKDGFRSHCKKCRNKESEKYRLDNQELIAKYREKNREQNREYFRRYKLENKEKVKRKNDEYRERNREKLREKHRIWRSKNRERLNEQYREYYRKNKDQIRRKKNLLYKKNIDEMRLKGKVRVQRYLAIKKELDNTLTEEQWELALSYFDEKCAYCGMERDVHIEKTGVDLHQEHFVPLSKGGGYTADNIVPSCRSCNSSKGNKLFSEWYPTHKHYSEEREKKILSFIN